jgi:transcription elongation factor Elf1
MELKGNDKGNTWQERKITVSCACCGNSYEAKLSELTMINDASSIYNFSWTCPNCGLLNKR